MKKNKNFGVPTPTVNLAINRSRIKKYNRESSTPTYYLKRGQEFQIELHNPTQGNILAKIKLNNKAISSGGLVLRPGERVFLDRFIETKHKLLFDTYEVSNNRSSKNAIKPNGDIKIEFFNEYIQQYYTSTINLCGSTNWPYGYDDLTTTNYSGDITYGSTGNVETTLTTNTSSITFDTANSSPTRSSRPIRKGRKKSKNIETGRVEKGSSSNQKLVETYGNYDSYAFHTIEYKLLPISQKKISSRDLHKIYCTECGTKNKSTYKFCPTCGKKI